MAALRDFFEAEFAAQTVKVTPSDDQSKAATGSATKQSQTPAAQPDLATDSYLHEPYSHHETHVEEAPGNPLDGIADDAQSEEASISSEDRAAREERGRQDAQVAPGEVPLDDQASESEHEHLYLDELDFYQSITISDDRSVQYKVDQINLHALRILDHERAQWESILQFFEYIHREDALHAYHQSTDSLPNLARFDRQSPSIASTRSDDLDISDQAEDERSVDFPIEMSTNGVETTYIQTSTLDRGRKRRFDDVASPLQSDSRPKAKQKSSLEDTLDGLPNDPATRDVPSQIAIQFDGLTQNLSVDHLLDLSRRLQSKIRTQDSSVHAESSYRFQLFYRTLTWVEAKGANTEPRQHLSKPYTEIPQWIDGHGKRGTFRCHIPVDNLDLYLEQNKDIAFIVYRTYVEPTAEELQKHRTDYRNKSFKPAINESIQPIQSNLLDALVSLLTAQSEYGEILQHLQNKQEILEPYIFCYHHRQPMTDMINDEEHAAGPSLELLLDYIQDTQGPKHRAVDDLILQKRVSHECLPFLFKPSDVLVYRESDGNFTGWVATGWPKCKERTREVRRKAEKRVREGIANHLSSSGKDGLVSKNDYVYLQTWSISASHWEFDGAFYRVEKVLDFSIIEEIDQRADIDWWAKAKTGDLPSIPINDLRLVPIDHCPEHVRDTLQQRGQIFWKCRERRFVSYQEDDGHGLASDERYVVDLQTYRSIYPSGFWHNADELGDEVMRQEQCPEYPFELLLPLKIKGFNLRRKKWYDLMADRISDVVWRKDAFSKIAMDGQAKEIIRALITKKIAAERSTDLIAGKGNGLILLLHGGPGTGKTLTAESVAEIAEKPLYRVTCGDVGTQAENVEKYLESVFHLGKLWGCVVLMDEADVFLEQRDLKDLERNALVSVFLRVLEYYEGILVLTSNRVGTFDDAFRSRIQLALHYPALTESQRWRIWENFIDRLETFEDGSVNTKELRFHIDDLSKIDMNGREIRNAITTARQYADYLNTIMTYEHLKDVIRLSKRFDKYLLDLRSGQTEEEIKRDEGIR